ncbi:MAG: hypothetical protein HC889_00750 [Synechococcaceae cyanobacterium SM1_2_3]|nr:hypothetical protein [Synechococcaceae cyanobacterium SM1_2_3]
MPTPWAALINAGVKYLVIAACVGLATWWFLGKLDRAAAADRFETQLATEHAAAKAAREFQVQVEGLRSDAEKRWADFEQRLAQASGQRVERIIERLPANSRVCLDADVVQLLNARHGSAAAMPPAAGQPDGPPLRLTPLAAP